MNGQFSWLLGAALVVWLAVAVAGWYGISAYGFSGDQRATAHAPQQWPADSTIARMPGRATLVLFLHPKCPCSRASVAELERLSVLVPPAALPDICVVASAPRSTGDRWWSSPLLVRAARLPNAHIVRDPGGVETALFNVQVSGTVLLFDEQGRRLYAGGVTMSRGHDGDNAGLRAVAALLIDHNAHVSSIPSFGCEVVREDVQSSDATQAPSSRAAGGDPT